jgi:hypothetical protein
MEIGEELRWEEIRSGRFSESPHGENLTERIRGNGLRGDMDAKRNREGHKTIEILLTKYSFWGISVV